jgi:hypothetical protein
VALRASVEPSISAIKPILSSENRDDAVCAVPSEQKLTNIIEHTLKFLNM